MSKKFSKKDKEELCNLYSEALCDFTEFFKGKKKALKSKKAQKKENQE